jgi:hypothetical protein
MSNNVKISGTPGGEINIKRLYLPGVQITATCPCGNELVKDFEIDYLSYPAIDEPYNVYLPCENCNDAAVTVQVVLKVSLELVAPTD